MAKKRKRSKNKTVRIRQAKKYNQLRKYGFSVSDSARLSRGKTELSFADIDRASKSHALAHLAMRGQPEYINYSSSEYLCVLWVSLANEGHFTTGRDIIESWNIMQKKKQARLTYENADENGTGSDGKDGVAKWFHGSLQACNEFMERVARAKEQNREHRLNGEPTIREYTIVQPPNNIWNAMQFGDLLNLVTRKATDENARIFYRDMAAYTKYFYPEINKLLFKY